MAQPQPNEARDKWKAKDPASYAAQERRRVEYANLKKTGKVCKAAVAMPILSCKGFLYGPNETFYSPHDVDASAWATGWPAASAVDFVAILKIGRILIGTTQSELLHTAKVALMEGGH